MKTFKDLNAFEKRLKKGLCWDDFIKLNGLIYYTYEYGGGSMMKMDHDYIYFLNKRTKTLIFIKYICPSFVYIDGERKQVKQYHFIGIEQTLNADLWR